MKSNLFSLYSNMIAPCGLNCNACYAHLRVKNRCSGCNLPDANTPNYCRKCAIKSCAESKALILCVFCEDYPCKRIKHIDKRYRDKYHVQIIAQSQELKAIGIETFMANEKTRWTCSNCGGVINMHTQTCSECSASIKPGE